MVQQSVRVERDCLLSVIRTTAHQHHVSSHLAASRVTLPIFPVRFKAEID
jgi:hypothetical protein